MLDSKPMLDHSQPAYSVDQHRPTSEPMVARFKIFSGHIPELRIRSLSSCENAQSVRR